MNKKFARLSLTAFVVVTLALAFAGIALAFDSGGTPEDIGSDTITWTGQGASDGELNEEICPSTDTLPDGIDPNSYLHWILTTDGGEADTNATLHLGTTAGGNDLGDYSTTKDSGGAFHFFTPYFTPDSSLHAYADIDVLETGNGSWILTISHGCPGENDFEELTVSKSVETSFTRTHNWDITKKVETDNGATHDGYPKIWLYVDGSGDETATWTVEVTYGGYVDSDHNISGEINIENTGTLDATITSVDDVLAGAAIDVDCGVTFPYTFPAGATLTCTYDEDGYVEGFNEASVTTERDTYNADPVEIVWGDPTTEFNETVTIEDSIEGSLGTVTAPNGDTFTYSKDYAWADYGQENCGDHVYNNTATIVETGQSASATLKVNVQCLIFQGETAWAANGNTPGELRYNSRSANWATYVQYLNVAKCTTLFAGQTIDVGEVCFSAPVSGSVTITVTLDSPWEFEDVAENLKVQDYAKAPSGNPSPGLFAYKTTCDSAFSTCSITVPVNKFYGVHVSVGQWIPDPNFGP